MKSYFSDHELKCECCGRLIIDDIFLFRLNWARHIADFPFIINSGYRCPTHNAEVDSTSTNHINGKAVDILCTDHNQRYKIIAALISAGILGIGINISYIHGDTNRTYGATWTNGDP